MQLTRRSFAGLISMAAGSLVIPGYAAEPLNDPTDILHALIKLRGTLDERLVMWWMKGMRYGVVDDRIKPLFGMKTGGFQLYKELADGRHAMTMLELSFFTDPETDRLLEQFKNPYSGKLVDIPEQRLGPYTVYHTTSGVEIPRDPSFGEFQLRTQLRPAVVQSDDVWIREDSFVYVDSDHPMMGKHTYNEFVTYHGSLHDIRNPDLDSAPATVTYQSVTSWRKWMGAEGVGGHTTARAAGRKCFSLDEFPDDYLELLVERYPKIAKDPRAAVANNIAW